MFPEPFVSRANALPVKRNERGYGDENGAEQELRSAHGRAVNKGIVLQCLTKNTKYPVTNKSIALRLYKT